MKGFYVYVHKDFNNNPFYVGKGKGKRYLDTKHRNIWWMNKVKKMRGFVTAIVKDNLDEKSALRLEIETIAKYRKLGIKLCNNTNGGEGCSGYIHTEQYKEMMRNRLVTEETRAKISAARKGTKLSYETKTKIGLASKGRYFSPEARAKISAAGMGNQYNLGRCAKPETKLKMSIARKGKKFTAEHRERISKALKGIKRKPLSEEHKLKLSIAGMGNKNSISNK